jgi:hypothetical protein
MLALLAGGCDGDGAGEASPDEPLTTTLPRGDDPVELDAESCTTDIDNRYWPMVPGTRWAYREVDDGGETLEVVVTVTSATKDAAKRRHRPCGPRHRHPRR